jgi:hypothetical protein
MSKPAQVRLFVSEVDQLLLLTEAQLKVWLYYKRRMGVDGRAWGKASEIAKRCGFQNPQTVKNARNWLSNNGWLKPNGPSKSGLPMYLAVIPDRTPESTPDENERTPESTAPVLLKVPQPYSEEYTEVPTLEGATLKHSALPSGVSESVNEIAAVAAVSPVSLSNSSVEKEGKSNPPGERTLQCTEAELKEAEYLADVMGWGARLDPNKPIDDSYMDFLEDALACRRLLGPRNETDFAMWQFYHPKGNLRPFRSMAQLRKALESTYESGALHQFDTHLESHCGDCLRRLWEHHRVQVSANNDGREHECVCDTCRKYKARMVSKDPRAVAKGA